jgi:hypothetical protein
MINDTFLIILRSHDITSPENSCPIKCKQAPQRHAAITGPPWQDFLTATKNLLTLFELFFRKLIALPSFDIKLNQIHVERTMKYLSNYQL